MQPRRRGSQDDSPLGPRNLNFYFFAARDGHCPAQTNYHRPQLGRPNDARKQTIADAKIDARIPNPKHVTNPSQATPLEGYNCAIRAFRCEIISRECLSTFCSDKHSFGLPCGILVPTAKKNTSGKVKKVLKVVEVKTSGVRRLPQMTI